MLNSVHWTSLLYDLKLCDENQEVGNSLKTLEASMGLYNNCIGMQF